MKLKGKFLSSYPILNAVGRDYLSSTFKSDINYKLLRNDININVKYQIKGFPEMEQLIAEHKAAYCLHVECPKTSYRKKYLSFDKELNNIIIPQNNIATLLEISTFIVTLEDIHNFTAENMSCIWKDDSDQEITIAKHQIIAMGDSYELNIVNDNNISGNNNSIIKYIRLKDPNRLMYIDTDGSDYISIAMNEKLLKDIQILGKQTYKETIMSLIIVPAMTIIFQRMYENKDNMEMQEAHWYQVLEQTLNRYGYNVDDLKIDSQNLFDIVQTVLKDPIFSAVNELKKKITEKEEL